MTDARRVEEVVVVIPAHDEQQLVGACLDAVSVAVERAESDAAIRCRVVMVLDDCTDDTAEIVAGYRFVQVLEVERRNVGAAREHGVRWALGRSSDVAGLWIANTDADSAVPSHWITHQVELARAGADVIVGSVRPFGEELSPAQYAAWLRRETADPARIHVHGANLGVRADAYLATGGFDPHPEHEDVMLVERMIAAGFSVTATDGCRVDTSARLHGRTPGGFAAHLRDTY